MKKNKLGFTLLELLVVIFIIGVLSTMAIVALQSARKSARDAKRVSDIRQMQTALELYFHDWQEYPSSMTAGGPLSTGTPEVTYMYIIPSGPTPADGSCSAAYSYSQALTGASYTIQFCLGGNIGALPAGNNCAIPGGISGGTCD